jgi:hypothetical protein
MQMKRQLVIGSGDFIMYDALGNRPRVLET